MRLFPALFGLSWSLGLLVSFPSPASAAIDCDRLASAAPLSAHYVGRTLDRADDAIASAAGAASNSDFSIYLPWWARSIAGSFASIIDTGEGTAARVSDLATTTACLRYDQILLECKIDDVREALDAELERGSFVAIIRLQSLLTFLQEELAHLARGAVDGRYEDAAWARQRTFDEEAPEALEEPLCPFLSDYAPPAQNGFGCDTSVLQEIVFGNEDGALPFVEAEMLGLLSIEREVDRFREVLPLLRAVSLQSDTDADAPPPPAPAHRVLAGCRAETGVCSDDNATPCGSTEFCASKNKGVCLRDASQPVVMKQSLRGPFSATKEHLQVLLDFAGKRVDDGLSRTFREDFTQREEEDVMLGSARTAFRVLFRSVSERQGRAEGMIFAEAADAPLEAAGALGTLRASVGALSRMAAEKTGLRAFVTEFAFFLRRTCTERPCQAALEQIIRIGLQDDCFPYTNGEFLNDTKDAPRWKKCAEAACVAVEGANLPGNCAEILPPAAE